MLVVPTVNEPPSVFQNCTAVIADAVQLNLIVTKVLRMHLSSVEHSLASYIFPSIPTSMWSYRSKRWVPGTRIGKKADVIQEVMHTLPSPSKAFKRMNTSITILECNRISPIIKLMQNPTTLLSGAEETAHRHKGDLMKKKSNNDKKTNGNGKGKKAKPKKGKKAEKPVEKAPEPVEAPTVQEEVTALLEEDQAKEIKLPKAKKPKREAIYAGKKLAAFTLDGGSRHEIRSFKALMVGVTTQLLDGAENVEREKLLALTGSKRPYFAAEGENMIRGHQIEDKFWVETNLSADRIVELSHRAMAIFEHKPEDLKLEYREA